METKQIQQRTQLLYWRNSVDRIREKIKILSSIPSNYLDYESCNFIQSCLKDYADVCEGLQTKENEELSEKYGEVEEIPQQPINKKCPKCGKSVIWSVTGEPTVRVRFGYWSCSAYDFSGCNYVEKQMRVK